MNFQMWSIDIMRIRNNCKIKWCCFPWVEYVFFFFQFLVFSFSYSISATVDEWKLISWWEFVKCGTCQFWPLSFSCQEVPFLFLEISSRLLVDETLLDIVNMSYGDVTRDDSQRRSLAQHSVAMLEQCCHHLKQCRSNVATLHCAKNRRCKS